MAEPALPPARYEPADVTFRFLLCGAGVVLARSCSARSG